MDFYERFKFDDLSIMDGLIVKWGNFIHFLQRLKEIKYVDENLDYDLFDLKEYSDQ